MLKSAILEEAIYKTVAFFDVLDYCLTEEEICERLLGFQATKDEILLGLAMSSTIETDGAYHYLKGRNSLIDLRVSNGSFHEEMWKKLERLKWIFSTTPFLRNVYVCNTLAMTQARPGSDIDLYIVTQPRRLFIVRTWLLLLTQLLGIRRHGSNIEGRFCLSFFVDENHTDLSEFFLKPVDVYFEFWNMLLKPIYANSKVNSSCMSSWFDRIDLLLSKWQLRRARSKFEKMGKPTGVVLEPYCLKLHDKDMREVYQQEWEKRLK